MTTLSSLSLTPSQRLFHWYRDVDPRIPVAGVLFTYLVLGLTVLGFNRTPWQALATTTTCLTADVLFTRLFDKKWVLPLSALITSLSLSFLLNYSHDFFLLFIPVFYAIGSKQFFRFNNKHALNPAMMGVSLTLFFSAHLVTAAPAYQWNGITHMSIFVAGLGMLFVIPKVNRQWLVFSWLTFFTINTALRALIMRHHLPFETLFLGTLSSPSFFIFTFFMITDPATSPKDRRDQIIVGFALAMVDLLLHLRQSYYTFFYAALIVGSTRLAIRHFKAARPVGFGVYLREAFWLSGYWKRPLLLLTIALTGYSTYTFALKPTLGDIKLDWSFQRLDSAHTGLVPGAQGDIYERLDPRVSHVAKWVLSVGDSVSVGDFDNDGRQDLFLTNVLKAAPERYALFRNAGDHRFERVPLPALAAWVEAPEKMGLISNGVFADYDNDGDQDLFLTVAFGRSILLQNQLMPTGKADFTDVTVDAGLANDISTSISASYGDFNQDGLLDLLVLNVWPEFLPNYATPERLNLFGLPQPAHEGDERMFDFMHDSWHLSNNGGLNWLYLQTPDHRFVRQDSAAWGMPETRWSLAVGVADLNADGWPEIYVANDFGPDDLYYNDGGKRFRNIKGKLFGDIGRDTYKGMNVSVADFDQSGWLDVYVTNVHHAFQAEGSLLWTFRPGKDGVPLIEETATKKTALNEERFGWGATATDFDNDGKVDIAVANGMVDDTWDKKFDECPDYWYVNEKVARSPPHIHRFVNKWGDMRGYCIYGKEKNRVYLNRGAKARPQFVDVADQVGVVAESNHRGVATADFDNRGRRDLVFTRPFNTPVFYRNDARAGAPANQWVGLELTSVDPGCNREAIGTRVLAQVTQADGTSHQLLQEVQAVSGFNSQNDKRLHFGLGPAPRAVSLKVKWCGRGPWVELPPLAAGRYHRVVGP
jgi:Na+-translocating ferredoxin:NAD+ oxidoreductase RnfD subunit